MDVYFHSIEFPKDPQAYLDQQHNASLITCGTIRQKQTRRKAGAQSYRVQAHARMAKLPKSLVRGEALDSQVTEGRKSDSELGFFVWGGLIIQTNSELIR